MVMRSIAILVYVVVIVCPSLAQDAHYWTEQYGNRSMLLNGSVIGSVEDLGAVYYNPARISQFETPAFVISAQVYQYTVTTIEDGLGDGINLKKDEFGGGPSLVSGTFKLPFLKNHQFAYAFLTRFKAESNFTYSVDDEGEYVESMPGDELFSGQISLNKSRSDEWIGGSWSHALNDRFSVGGFRLLFRGTTEPQYQTSITGLLRRQ